MVYQRLNISLRHVSTTPPKTMSLSQSRKALKDSSIVIIDVKSPGDALSEGCAGVAVPVGASAPGAAVEGMAEDIGSCGEATPARAWIMEMSEDATTSKII